MVGTPAVQALERGLVAFLFVCVFFVCLFVFRVGLRLKKIEQKVQRSRIYPSPSVSPVINILY